MSQTQVLEDRSLMAGEVGRQLELNAGISLIGATCTAIVKLMGVPNRALLLSVPAAPNDALAYRLTEASDFPTPAVYALQLRAEWPAGTGFPNGRVYMSDWVRFRVDN